MMSNNKINKMNLFFILFGFAILTSCNESKFKSEILLIFCLNLIFSKLFKH